MATIFTKIINNEIPAYKIAEDDRYLAFLDVFPIAKGHTLVVPKKEVDNMFDLDDDLLGGLHVFAKKIAKAIEQVVACKRVGTAVIGLEVPHAHLHLIPINNIGDISFTRPKLKFTEDEFKKIAKDIKSYL